MNGRDQLEGLVLCRVGEFHLAFSASSVGSIGSWEVSDSPLPLARWAYALPAAPGKLLMEEGASLVVDGVEISPEPLQVLPVPAVLAGAVGGALRGFVVSPEALMPLLGFSEFARYVASFKS